MLHTSDAESVKTLTPALLDQLQLDFPKVHFAGGEQFFWSPKDQTVFYDAKKLNEPGRWALLHELSHCLLRHTTYKTDFELLQLEVAAWHKAEALAVTYGLKIDQNHIQNCLDTYRDWLHARSECPSCSEHGLQTNSTTYTCLNCHTEWKVSSARFCRPYRMKSKKSL